MDPLSFFMFHVFGTTLESTPPSFCVGFYDTGFQTSSCDLCRLGQDVPEKVKRIKDLNSNLDNLRGLAYSR